MCFLGRNAIREFDIGTFPSLCHLTAHFTPFCYSVILIKLGKMEDEIRSNTHMHFYVNQRKTKNASS